MKRFFAALLAISMTAVWAGCDKPAEEQLIDDITEVTSAVVKVTETTSESVSETETEMGTSAETVSEIKSNTVTEKRLIQKNSEKPFRQMRNHFGVNGMP